MIRHDLEVQIRAIKPIEVRAGVFSRPGDGLSLESSKAQELVEAGLAVYNSDFREELLPPERTPESRVRTAERKAARTDAPKTPKKKRKGLKDAGNSDNSSNGGAALKG